MATEEKLSGALQENILTLLCFDAEFCKRRQVYAVVDKMLCPAIVMTMMIIIVIIIISFINATNDTK